MDFLQLPVLGRVLQWRHLRTTLQLVLLAFAASVVLHGLWGPEIAPRNLSTVLTSIHWRGLLVIGLVVFGNVFCTACPMILARDAGRRVFTPRFSWPRALRRKWIGLTLLVLVLFAYELFDFWERPAATAWLVLAYFGLALVVDVLFRGATFCKFICPIGQFNFIASTLSPVEVRVRSAETCRSCRTSDCIKGQWDPVQPLQLVRRGCELGLFLPAKAGNLDCTFCLDCVHACPHENVAIATRVPGLELLDTRRRSAIGRLLRRPDLAALAVVFTFGALVNAFAMTAPAGTIERDLASLLRVHSEAPVLVVLFVIALVLFPALLLLVPATLTRIIARDSRLAVRAIALRFAFALVPLGLGMWLAHYGFHLMTGMLTAVPVAQSAAIDLFGWPVFGEPLWRWIGMQPGTVYPLQVGVIVLGACGSIALVGATSARDYPSRPAMVGALWTVPVLVLTIAAVWILSQPMDMRGLGGLG